MTPTGRPDAAGAGGARPTPSPTPWPTLPRTASEHPAAGRFGYPLFHPETRAAWRRWLEANHGSTRGVWLVSWRRTTGRPAVPYEQAVEESLCFGWIDSTVTILDDERSLQLMTPRKPRSTWTRLNRERVARLDAEGRMSAAGRRAVEVARANGWWTILDPVEDLLEPVDLAAALDAVPPARVSWDGFPPSARKQLLWWVISAVKPETRSRRIATIIADAAEGRRPRG
jgi:uncharacterized protein YdeI (YjbR/CyaY-like superfamily)